VWQPFCEDGPDKHGVAGTETSKGGIGIRKEENVRLKGGRKRKWVKQRKKKAK